MSCPMFHYADSIGQDMGQGKLKIKIMDKDFNDFWDAYRPTRTIFPNECKTPHMVPARGEKKEGNMILGKNLKIFDTLK